MLVIFGDYVVGNTESNDFTLNLKEFGTIKISITENHASITIDGVVYVAVKASEVDLTENTKKLCGTWSVKFIFSENGDIYDETMIFTSAGTYFESDIDSDTGEINTENGTWSWKANNILSVSYTSYWVSNEASVIDPETGEIIPGKTETGVEYGVDEWKIIELTDTKFVAEYDDEGDKVTVRGTKK